MKQTNDFQLILIQRFYDLPAGNKANILKIITLLINYSDIELINDLLIVHAVECFGMKQHAFPEFIISLINNQDIDHTYLKEVLIDCDVIYEIQDNFPDSYYNTILNNFIFDYE